MMTRAERLKEIRKQLGWTQDALAERAPGMDREWISKIERGKNKVSGGQIQASLAAAFGVSIPELLAALDGQTDVHAFAATVRSASGAPAPTRVLMPDAELRPPELVAADDDGIRYPELIVAIRELRDEGKPPTEATVRRVTALVFKEARPSVSRWREIIAADERMQELAASGRPLGIPVRDEDVAKPTFKKRGL